MIFPSGCEACTINLDKKNMKISIFTGVTSVRLKNIFTAISRYPTGKHEINLAYFQVSPFVKLKMGGELSLYVDNEHPTHCFSPCGHMASEKTVK